jgi:hypothetical protein
MGEVWTGEGSLEVEGLMQRRTLKASLEVEAFGEASSKVAKSSLAPATDGDSATSRIDDGAIPAGGSEKLLKLPLILFGVPLYTDIALELKTLGLIAGIDCFEVGVVCAIP